MAGIVHPMDKVTTLSALIRPLLPARAGLFDAVTVLGASVAIGLAGQVAFPLPFTPVPVTMQTLVALLAGAALGSRRGALAAALLLVEGAAGLPVFSAGRAGLAHLLGPTGGYLWGFVGAAFVTGLLAERGWDRRPLTAAAAMVAGSMAMYAVGLAWLSAFVGADRVLALGLVPFVPGDLVKIAAATAILPLAWRAARR